MASTCSRKYIFNAEEHALMELFKQEYLSVATSPERKNIAIAKIFPCIVGKWKSELPPGEKLDFKEALKTVLAWIRNNWRLGKSPTNAKIVVKRSEVIWTYHQHLVFEEIAKLMDIAEATQETPGWFNHRMKAIKIVYKNMSEAEHEALQTKKTELARQGFPEDEKPKRAARFANRRLDAAAKAQFLEIGLLSITIMSCMEPTPAGDYHIAVKVHDNIADIMGVDMPSFETMYEDAVLGVKKLLLEYVKEIRKATAHNPVDDVSVGMGDKVYLKYDDAGYPILSGFNQNKHLSKMQIERLVRAYLSSHYSHAHAAQDLASGNKGIGQKSPPYARIGKQQSRYIHAKYLPKNFVLMDPRNMKHAAGFAFLEHISEQQVLHSTPTFFASLEWAIAYPGDPSNDSMSQADMLDSPQVAAKSSVKQHKQHVKKQVWQQQVEPERVQQASMEHQFQLDIKKQTSGQCIQADDDQGSASEVKKQTDDMHVATIPSEMPGGIQYVFTFGPNDPIPHGPGIYHIPVHGQPILNHTLPAEIHNVVVDHQNPIIPFTGVIDPSLIGLKADVFLTPCRMTPNNSQMEGCYKCAPVKPELRYPSPLKQTTSIDEEKGDLDSPNPTPVPQSESATDTMPNVSVPLGLKPNSRKVIPRPRPKSKYLQLNPQLPSPTCSEIMQRNTQVSINVAASPLKAKESGQNADIAKVKKANKRIVSRNPPKVKQEEEHYTHLPSPTNTETMHMNTATDVAPSPIKAKATRCTADILAAVEAKRLDLPAKRNRKLRVRTT